MKKIYFLLFLLFYNFALGEIKYDNDEIRSVIKNNNLNFIKNEILVKAESIEELNDILFIAAEEKNIEVMETLLESGAEINSINSNGDTPLAVYIKSYEKVEENERYGVTSRIRYLIELGANINAKCSNDETPFLLAMKFDLGDIEQMILNQGANVNVKDNEGNTPFLLAVSQGKTYVMEYIYGKNPKVINDVDNKGNNALTMAMLSSYRENNFCDVLDFLIEKKPDIINMKNKDGNTALNCALLADADENIYDYYKRNLIDEKKLLFKAIEYHANSIFQDLVRNYSYKDYQAEDGTTLLMYAIQKKNEKAISICVSYHMNVNLKDNKGNTALMYAVMESSEKIAEYLIKHGASKFIKNNEGKTIFDLAGSEEMKNFLKTGERSDEGEIEETQVGCG